MVCARAEIGRRGMLLLEVQVGVPFQLRARGSVVGLAHFAHESASLMHRLRSSLGCPRTAPAFESRRLGSARRTFAKHGAVAFTGGPAHGAARLGTLPSIFCLLCVYSLSLVLSLSVSLSVPLCLCVRVEILGSCLEGQGTFVAELVAQRLRCDFPQRTFERRARGRVPAAWVLHAVSFTAPRFLARRTISTDRRIALASLPSVLLEARSPRTRAAEALEDRPTLAGPRAALGGRLCDLSAGMSTWGGDEMCREIHGPCFVLSRDVAAVRFSIGSCGTRSPGCGWRKYRPPSRGVRP